MTKSTAFSTNLTPYELVKMCGISEEEQTAAVNKLAMDQNVKIVAGKIVVPDMISLVKQAAFYRKQNTRRSNEK